MHATVTYTVTALLLLLLLVIMMMIMIRRIHFQWLVELFAEKLFQMISSFLTTEIRMLMAVFKPLVVAFQSVFLIISSKSCVLR